MNLLDLPRIERWVWYVFVAVFAWQTRLIVWQADTRFIEWRSGSLYLTDILMLVLFVVACIRGRRWFVRRMDPIDWVLGLFIAAAVLSLAHADNIAVGLIGLVRLIQGILFYLYLRHWAWNHVDGDRTAIAFVAGALLQSTIDITQYVLQHDIGLRLLGEPIIRTDMRGVAVFFDTHTVKVLRAYGTFPHPNVLAAYLMTALWVTIWLWMRHGNLSRRFIWVWPLTTALLLVAFFLTYSRTVIAAFLLTLIVAAFVVYVPRISGRWHNIAVIRRRLRTMIVTILIVSAGFAFFLWPSVAARMTISPTEEAIALRIRYADDAFSSGSFFSWNINWIGVGIGNFTTWLSRYDTSAPLFMYQPAHNVFLMVYSETGLLGLLVWIVWLAMMIRIAIRAQEHQPAIRIGILGLVAAMLLIAMFDHFYWTLQQGRLLWWAVLALAAGRA